MDTTEQTLEQPKTPDEGTTAAVEQPKPVLTAAMPPQDVFVSKQSANQAYEVIKNGTQTFVLDHVDYPPEGGIFLHLKGLLFPRKGFPFPEAVWAVNGVKRITLILIFGFTNTALLFPALAYMLLPWRYKVKVAEKFLERYMNAANYIFAPYILQDKFYQKSSSELRKWIKRFLLNLGFSEQTSEGVSLTMCMVIEYDNAYRQRLQDALTYNVVFGRVTKGDVISNPRLFFTSIVKTIGEREPGGKEDGGVWDKYNRFARMASFAFWHPKIRRAFVDATRGVNFDNLYFDAADEYHCLMYGDYDYFGEKLPVRWKRLEVMHNGVLPFAHIIAPQP